jgi:murein L,D-transpeptidase YcbB/YkuD
MRNRTATAARVAAALWSVSLLAACGDKPSAATSEAADALAVTTARLPKDPSLPTVDDLQPPPAPAPTIDTSAYDAFLDAFQGGLRADLMKRMGEQDLKVRLQDRLTAAADGALLSPPADDLANPLPLLMFYTGRGFEPWLLRGYHLTPAAKAMLAFITDVESHAMSPADYGVEWLLRTAQETDALSSQMESYPGLELFPREREALALYLKGQRFDPATPDAAARLTELLLSGSPDNPLPRLSRAFHLCMGRQQHLLDTAIELEVKLADAYLRFAREMNLGNTLRLSEEERARYDIPSLNDPLPPQHRGEVIFARLLYELEAVAAFTEPDDVTRYVRATHWPPHDQYDKLRDALRRYRAIVAAGGWKRVPSEKLNRGGVSPVVRLLKERLAAEGLYTGDMNEVFDDGLVEAIKRYQRTHQIEVNGEVHDPVFWSSLNVPAEKRLEMIEANLRRWRQESRMLPSKHYVYINIPDFHAEVWKDGKRDMRFRIIVGSSTRKCMPSTRKFDYPYATPLQHAKLWYIVFNPYWNVPYSIEVNEYAPLMQRDPKWLEKNNFEYFEPKSGGRVLRQKPGPQNALGMVKFLFPNKHDTYMHDTPDIKKPLFEYPIRAFSHGCMRVQNPMDLANYFVRGAGKWDDLEIKRAYRAGKEYNVELDEAVDVFIEYTNVRVHDDNDVHFLSDIYKIIHDEISPPHARFRVACTPDAPGGAAGKPDW